MVTVDAILNTVASPITVLDGDGAIVKFNPAAERLTGYAAEEVLGRKVWDLLIINEEIDAVRAVFDKTSVGPQPTHFTNYWKTRTGEARLIEWSNAIVEDERSGARYILATGVDITKTASAQHELTESQAFLRSVIDACPVAVITTDEFGSILSFSRKAEEIFGYAENNVHGENIEKLMPARDGVRHDQFMARYLRTGERRILGQARDVIARRRNSEEFPATLHLSEFQDGMRIFVAFIEDISDRRAIERRLEHTQSQLQHAGRIGAMGEMATSIAHELNQPLTAAASLAGAAALIAKKADFPESENVATLLEDAVGETRRASQIIRRMRDFIQKKKTRKTPCPLNAVVEDAAAIALIGAEAEDVDVEYQLNDAVGDAVVDRIQIQQVVVNLVRNALEAMRDAPVRKLTISTARVSEGLEIAIDDTGCGVDGEMRKQLFTPFSTDKPDGLGVGLSISKSLVDAHQGELRLIDKQSEGSRFVVRLPEENNVDRGDNQ